MEGTGMKGTDDMDQASNTQNRRHQLRDVIALASTPTAADESTRGETRL
jgi:hypothetical protein